METKKLFKRTNTFAFILFIIVASVLLSQLINKYVLIKATVEGVSMENTLKPDETVLVCLSGYVAKNKVIVIQDPSNPNKKIVKRCIATPGDSIYCFNGIVYVNDEVVEDNWSKGVTSDFSKVILQDNQYFVMGDNRVHSRDSRTFGPIDKNLILGVAIFW